jgi:hypothetical protein
MQNYRIILHIAVESQATHVSKGTSSGQNCQLFDVFDMGIVDRHCVGHRLSINKESGPVNFSLSNPESLSTVMSDYR